VPRSVAALLWSGLESFGQAGLSVLAFVVLARLLDPHDFGVAAIAAVFILVSNLVAAQGFAEALVQREDLTPLHIDAAFWGSLATAALCCAALLAAAPGVALLFGEPKLQPVLSVLALALPLNALGCVPMAMLRRTFRFRTFALRSLAGRAAGAVAGIAMAADGHGVWSLVAQQVVAVTVTSLLLLPALDRRPRLRGTGPAVRDLLGFGLHVSAAQTVMVLSEQALVLVIGWLWGPARLGWFALAWRIVDLTGGLVSSAVHHVALGSFARLQSDLPALRRAVAESTAVASAAGFPLAAGLSLVAAPAVATLFGARWAPAAPLLAILALELAPAFYTMVLPAMLRARGRPDITLWLALARLATGIGGIAIAAGGDIAFAAIALVARSALLLPVEIAFSARQLGIPATSLALLAARPLAATLVMVSAVLPTQWLLAHHVPAPVQLAGAVAAGCIVYAAALAALVPQATRMQLRAMVARL
jgi:PST family polysaccharide transporter